MIILGAYGVVFIVTISTYSPIIPHLGHECILGIIITNSISSLGAPPAVLGLVLSPPLSCALVRKNRDRPSSPSLSLDSLTLNLPGLPPSSRQRQCAIIAKRRLRPFAAP